MSRTQTSQTRSLQSKRGKRQSATEAKENIWSSLLDSVSSGKRLPEKNLIVLGGGSETQKEFLETLGTESAKRLAGRYRKRPSVANEFALGYTYQEVLDADQEDTLARLSIYTLPEPLTSFGPLLRPLLTPHTIPDTLLLILLDWAEPWNWLRQLRDWVCLLKGVLASLDDESKDVMKNVMEEWPRRQAVSTVRDSMENRSNESAISVPLGSGEFDEGLGLPLSIACHNAEKTNSLEIEKGWREEEFDYVLQFLRTISLKHGASLVYTSNANPNSLPSLVQSTLGIQSLLKRQPLKHNVIDRDKILIPANWDSWSKIRILREGFDVESVSNDWSAEIDKYSHAQYQEPGKDPEPSEDDFAAQIPLRREQSTLLRAFSEVIQDPAIHTLPLVQSSSLQKLEVDVIPNQGFLASQLDELERLKASEEHIRPANGNEKGLEGYPHQANVGANTDTENAGGRVDEHIGTVQFNMGGIQVDADDMLKRLQAREREETPDKELSSTPIAAGPSTGLALSEKVDSVALTNFFQGLIKKGGGANSPRTKAQQ